MLKAAPHVRSVFTRALSPWAFAVVAALAATQAFAGIYSEAGDAGQTQGTAQNTTGVAAPLTDIFGTLSSGTDADLFLIYIANPALFSASTNNSNSGLVDTHLFLLTLAGVPVYINDNANGATVLSTLPAGSAFGPSTAGYYLLGVATAGYNPININAQLLFAPGGTSTDVRGPAPLISPAVLGGFSGSPFDLGADSYDIRLSGVGLSVPEPSSGLLAALAAVFCALTALPRRSRAPWARTG